MKKVYVKDTAGKVSVTVSDELADALAETRRAIWRNEAKEMYYRGASLDTMTDKDKRVVRPELNPETILIAAEERRERGIRLSAAFKTLTARQVEVVKLLMQGKSATLAAAVLGITKQSINDIRKAVQKKFEEFL